jgi:hypothetical protein
MIHLRRFFQVGGDNISFTVAELRDDKTIQMSDFTVIAVY